MTLERCRALRRALRHELVPLRAFGRGQSIDQVAVQDRLLLADAEETERGLVAREQNTVEANPYQARLPLEEPAQ